MDDEQTRLCGARYQCASYIGDDLDDLPEETQEVVTIMSNHETTCGANFWDDTSMGPYRFVKDKSSWDLGVKGNVKDLQEEVSLGELQMDENNFDGIFVALLTCFATMTLEGWTITIGFLDQTLCITECLKPTAEAKPKREKKKGDAFLTVIQKARTTAEIASHKKKPKGFRLFGFSVGLPPWVGAREKLEKKQKPPSSASVIPAYKTTGGPPGAPEELDSDLVQSLTSVKFGGQDGNMSGAPTSPSSKGSGSPRSPSAPAQAGGRLPVGRDGRPIMQAGAHMHAGAKRAVGLKLPTFL
eukprot:g17213.t1